MITYQTIQNAIRQPLKLVSTLRILLVRPIKVVRDDGAIVQLERMKIYLLPKEYALNLVEQGYAVRIGFLSELPLQGYHNWTSKPPPKTQLETFK